MALELESVQLRPPSGVRARPREMPLVPVGIWSVVVPLPPHQLASHLAAAVDAPSGGCARPLQGRVHPGGFCVWRRPSHRNGFSPVMCGVVSPYGRGSIVEVTVALRPRALGLAAAWVLGVLGAALLLGTAPLTPIGLLGLGAALGFVAYGFEATATREVLEAALDVK